MKIRIIVLSAWKIIILRNPETIGFLVCPQFKVHPTPSLGERCTFSNFLKKQMNVFITDKHFQFVLFKIL